MDNPAAIISCIAAVVSVGCLVLFTWLQSSRKIVDAFKVEILRLFYSEPTASIFQWCRKTSNPGIPPTFWEIKGFFPAPLRCKYCERYFAPALVEVNSELNKHEYSRALDYDKSMESSRSRIFKFIESHEKEFRSAVRGEDFLSVHCVIDKYFDELCEALRDTAVHSKEG